MTDSLEMNLMTVINSWLDINCQIATKYATVSKLNFFYHLNTAWIVRFLKEIAAISFNFLLSTRVVVADSFRSWTIIRCHWTFCPERTNTRKQKPLKRCGSPRPLAWDEKEEEEEEQHSTIVIALVQYYTSKLHTTRTQQANICPWTRLR